MKKTPKNKAEFKEEIKNLNAQLRECRAKIRKYEEEDRREVHLANSLERYGQGKMTMLLIANFKDYIPTWIKTLGQLPLPEDERLVKEATDLWAAIVLGWEGEEGEPPKIDPRLLPISANLMAGCGAIVTGAPWTDLPDICGLTRVQLSIAASADKKGFGLLFEEAGKERERRRVEGRQDELARRIDTGSERIFVVRRGRDNDELVKENVKNDTLLTEALKLDAASKTATAAAQQSPAGNVVNVGTIYNVEVPAFLAGEIKPKAKEITVNPE